MNENDKRNTPERFGLSELPITDEDLVEVERAYLRAVATRSLEGLDVLGFGEMSVALAWSRADAHLVAKRIASRATRTDAEAIATALRNYAEALEPIVRIAPSEVRMISNDQQRWVVYLVQTRFDRDVLVENILPMAEPSVHHPIVEAIKQVILSASKFDHVGVDAQFSNFAWIDDELVLFDIGTPFLFNADGSWVLDTKGLVATMPGLLRPVIARKVVAIFREMSSGEGMFDQALLSVVREKNLEPWLPIVIEAFQDAVDKPLDAASVIAKATARQGEARGLKRMMQLERMWSTRVRRRPFDVLLTDSFSGEIL